MPQNDIFLSVLSDDFGMCQAVNEGIVQAFTQGLLTDTNLMAPCPFFEEAVQLAKKHQIPVGIHNTFTAEWDNLRWSPLTPLKSMIQSDGTFHTTVADAWEKADMAEAEREFKAQFEKIESAGLKITHSCEHMGADQKLASLFSRVLREKKVPYRNFTLNGDKYDIPHFQWGSYFVSSMVGFDLETRKAALKKWIESLGPGHHIWAAHCAVDHPSLEAMVAPNSPIIEWTRLYRVLDQSLILDPEVRGWIETRGIRLAPMSECLTIGW